MVSEMWGVHGVHWPVQALIFGLLGVALGLLTSRVGPRILRRGLLILISVAGAIGIFVCNAILADSLSPELNGNTSLGGGVFLLGLWYVHGRSLQRRVDRQAQG